MDAQTHDPASDALEKTRLAALPLFDYDRERVAAAERLGVRLGTLDDEVAALRPTPDAAAGRAVTMPAVIPWDELVPGDKLLTVLSEAVRRHLIPPKAAANSVALWVLHTWVFERFQHTPRLTIRSPAKRCGKSTLLELLQIVTRRPLKADNISAAGMFRTVEALSPCSLLIDEADAFLRENEQLRGIMNSGFERGGMVIRVMEVNGEQTPMQFRTFAPLAVAAIGKLPDTVEDRAVPVVLQRKARTEVVVKLRAPGARAALHDLARMAARWADDEGQRLASDPATPDAMGDREGDISVPLLAIADNAGGIWPARARAALLTVFGIRAVEEGAADSGALLLADIRTIFDRSGRTDKDSRFASTAFCTELATMEERPWPEWRNGKPITPTQLAHVLRPFGIRPGTIRDGATTAKGYKRDDFADAWERYLPP
jgi:putative DNA primase/helicase